MYEEDIIKMIAQHTETMTILLNRIEDLENKLTTHIIKQELEK